MMNVAYFLKTDDGRNTIKNTLQRSTEQIGRLINASINDSDGRRLFFKEREADYGRKTVKIGLQRRANKKPGRLTNASITDGCNLVFKDKERQKIDVNQSKISSPTQH